MAVEIGQAYIPVQPDLSGFGKDVQRQSSGALGSIKDFAKKAALALGGAFAITKGVDFLKGAVDAASDLNETVSKSRTIFGPASAGLEKWASNSAKAFGQSRQQALDAAGTFGNLFVQLGIGSDKAAGMSTAMVELASDFASFHNANPAEVIEAQTAAFRGEYDALQRFVPTINAAAVEQEALAISGKKTTKELTLQEKALATQSLMMKGAGDAAGDFARTSDGLANKQRIQSARWADITAKVGRGLLPVMTALSGVMIDRVFPALETVGGVAKQVFEIFANRDFVGGPLSEDSGIVASLFDIRDAFAGFVDTVMPKVKVFGAFVQDNLKPILIGLGVVVGALVAPFASAVAAVVFAYMKFEGFRTVVDSVASAVGAFASYLVEQLGSAVEWVRTIWPQVSETIKHVINVAEGIIRAFVAVVSVVWKAWGDDLLRIAKTAFEYVRSTIDNVLSVIRGVIQTVLALINGDWGKAWDGIKSILSAVWDQMKAAVSAAIGVIKGVMGGIASAVGAAWQAGWDALKGMAKGAVDAVVGFVRELPGRILGFAGAMLSAGAGLGGKFLDGLKNGLTAAAGFAGDIAAGIVQVVKNAWNAVAGMINAFVPNSIGWGPFSLDLPDNPIPRFHSGGTITSSLPRSPGLAADERLIVAQVGEEVTRRGGDAPDPVVWGRLAAQSYAAELRLQMRAS